MYQRYRSYYQPKRNPVNTAKEKPADQVFSADDVWAAAAYADRINAGEYVKETVFNMDTGGVAKNSNRDIVSAQLSKNCADVTSKDRKTGAKARDFHKKEMLFRALKGGELNEFEKLISRVVEIDNFGKRANAYELAIVPSQIRTARQGMALADANMDVERSPLAPVGAKVEATVKVIKCVYSANYGVYFVTGKTESRHMVFFSYRDKVAFESVMHIKGAVKAHRDDATQLTRVKVV